MPTADEALKDLEMWLRALEGRLPHIIRDETGEAKKYFTARLGLYSGIADDIRRLWKLTPKAGDLKERLVELYAHVESYMPQKVDPAKRREARLRLQNADPIKVWENIQKGLEPKHDAERVKAIGELWDQWAAEKDIHEKAILQLELGASVAALLENIQALEDRLRQPLLPKVGE